MPTAVFRVRQTRKIALIDELRDAILIGKYAPGMRLVQEDLAEGFGTSRIPLREALRRLEGEGLVVFSPNRGAVVRPLYPKDVADLYDLRLALEALALERAAERFADLRDSTEARHRQARDAIATGDVRALFHLDRDFHAGLTLASGNSHLVAALDGHWSQIMRIMHAYLGSLNYPEGVWVDHEEIASAVALGDSKRAIERLRTHLITSRARILEGLREANYKSLC